LFLSHGYCRKSGFVCAIGAAKLCYERAKIILQRVEFCRNISATLAVVEQEKWRVMRGERRGRFVIEKVS